MMVDKKTIIDIVLCILLGLAVIFEIRWGMNMLTKKWESDTNKLISTATNFGKNIGIIDDTFSWPEAEQPRVEGDVVKIEGNKYKLNGTVTAIDADYNGTVYYADIDTKASKQLNYVEVVDANTINHFQEALPKYFNGETDGILDLLGTDTPKEEIECYQQTFMGGVIPVMYDTVREQYCMLLDCSSSFFLLKCSEPFMVTDGRVAVHYADPTSDPLKAHVWNHYELGAIDNTRWKLTEGVTYDELGNPISGNDMSQAGNNNESSDNMNDIYRRPSDDTARQTMVSYASKTFDSEGKALDGSVTLDLTSPAAKASEWVLTQTSYSFTDNGLTINGLSGKRNANEFEISGNVSNMISAERPWVLVVKFLGDSENLLGVRVVDNRSTPIAADGVSNFTVNLDSESGIDFSQITAIQFEVH